MTKHAFSRAAARRRKGRDSHLQLKRGEAISRDSAFDVQYFHHDTTAQCCLLSEEHARHPATPELTLEDSCGAERRLELIAQCVAHVVSGAEGRWPK
jgi:hypothetical protein